jgi:hypothetical protein
MLVAKSSFLHCTGLLCAFVLMGALSSCGKKATPSMPPQPLDFSTVLQYAQRDAFAYEQMRPFRSRVAPMSKSALVVPFVWNESLRGGQ